MKKGLTVLVVLLFVCISCIYIFIPSNLAVSRVVPAKSTVGGSYRYLSDSEQWKKWWPYSDSLEKNTNHNYINGYHYGDDSFSLLKPLLNSVDVVIRHKGNSINSSIYLIPLSRDSVIYRWECKIPVSNNPFKRLQQYFSATELHENMETILKHFRDFAQEDENIYGLTIKPSSTTDTVLLATKHITTHYPTTSEIYELINKLKQYAQSQNAIQTGYPMLNINKLNSERFQIMTAIPVNKYIDGTDPIFPVRMVPGRFMVTETKGGVNAMNEALNQLHLYFEDHEKTAMAIPFSYLVTDRSQEPDSTKWVTRIFAPVY
jgi:hypothetical protein